MMPERIKFARGLVREAEYGQLVARSKAGPELYERFAKVFDAEADRFIAACEQLDPEHRAGTAYRKPAGFDDAFGVFDVDAIVDGRLGNVVAQAKAAALNLDRLAVVRNTLCLGQEPAWQGVLMFPSYVVGLRYSKAARYGFAPGGEMR